ncbi:MAG: hypothetical protein ACO1NU_00880 [Arcticibacter sp.]
MLNAGNYTLRIALTFSLTSVGFSVCAQDDFVEGVTCTKSGRISGVLIGNKAVKTLTNAVGEFRLKAGLGDTLIVSCPGYRSDTVRVPESRVLIIEMQKINLLREVMVTATSLSAESVLKRDMNEHSSIYRKGDKSEMLTVSPLGFTIKVDKLYSALSRQGAQARRLQQILEDSYRNAVIDRAFSDRLVGAVTSYDGQKLRDFKALYRPSYEQVLELSEYDMREHVRRKLKEHQLKR